MTDCRKKSIELLAPAKNVECARQAILHGADAVYIGAPKFGARAAAGNSVEELAELVNFAHQYYARVYVTINTLIYDSELVEVEALIWQLWQIGVDALIVQDMGLTELNLPPIPLHASTQTDNRSIEKVAFLEQAGFDQVVLARELSLQQIKSIAEKTSVRLEVFIHGALCVSYSGQCYMSQYVSQRSANRGMCAQCCRLPYRLQDANGKWLTDELYLLSLKDLHRSTDDLEALIDAGVTSFKIEGRLKDVSYVKNVTAWYRQKLDDIMRCRTDLYRSSSGETKLTFEPDEEKSFHRSFTDYFLHQRPNEPCQWFTPKSTGEVLGYVQSQKNHYFLYSGKKELHNGDGLLYQDSSRQFVGFRVNRVEGNRVYPAVPTQCPKEGTRLFRNYNHAFETILKKTTASRKIAVSMVIKELEQGFLLTMADVEGHSTALEVTQPKQVADKPQRDSVIELMKRSAHPLFEVRECTLEWATDYFVPRSRWTEVRNQLYERFEACRRLAYPKQEKAWQKSSHPYPETSLSYMGNVLNKNAVRFYQAHGLQRIDLAMEANDSHTEQSYELMRCKHCLRYSFGACPRQENASHWDEPVYLVFKDRKFPLRFDCKACEMVVLSPIPN